MESGKDEASGADCPTMNDVLSDAGARARRADPVRNGL
jgi:hypothetical protein